MAPGLSCAAALALLMAMAALSAMPSVSVFAVLARSTSAGLAHGALTAAGIVLGDVFFVLLAVFGLSLLIQALGDAFVWVQYAGGAYLLWLGVLIWRSRRHRARYQQGAVLSSPLSSFMTGLLITLADQKAVLFYLGFLPAFVDLASLAAADVALILGITVVAVGGVKLAYAVAGARAGRVLGGRFGEVTQALAAAVVLAAGVWVIVRA